MNSPRANLVHTYVVGNKFQNILGGETDCLYGSITRIDYLTPLMRQRWPYLKGMWHIDDAKGYGEYYKTLREAKARAEQWWPGCKFKTRRK